MAMTLTNLDRSLLILALNSGNTLYLAPGESSSPIEAIELSGNGKVEKLVKNGLLMANAISKPGPATTTPKKGKSEPVPDETTTAPGKKGKAPK